MMSKGAVFFSLASRRIPPEERGSEEEGATALQLPVARANNAVAFGRNKAGEAI